MKPSGFAPQGLVVLCLLAPCLAHYIQAMQILQELRLQNIVIRELSRNSLGWCVIKPRQIDLTLPTLPEARLVWGAFDRETEKLRAIRSFVLTEAHSQMVFVAERRKRMSRWGVLAPLAEKANVENLNRVMRLFFQASGMDPKLSKAVRKYIHRPESDRQAVSPLAHLPHSQAKFLYALMVQAEPALTGPGAVVHEGSGKDAEAWEQYIDKVIAIWGRYLQRHLLDDYELLLSFANIFWWLKHLSGPENILRVPSPQQVRQLEDLFLEEFAPDLLATRNYLVAAISTE
jgi:hypothetical protein